MPVNPSKAAINATIKNPSAQRNILDLLCFYKVRLVMEKRPVSESGCEMVPGFTRTGHDFGFSVAKNRYLFHTGDTLAVPNPSWSHTIAHTTPHRHLAPLNTEQSAHPITKQHTPP